MHSLPGRGLSYGNLDGLCRWAAVYSQHIHDAAPLYRQTRHWPDHSEQRGQPSDFRGRGFDPGRTTADSRGGE